MSEIILYKNRTNRFKVNLGIDVSTDTFTCQVREKALVTAPLIATATSVTFETTGVDGVLYGLFDDSTLNAVTAKSGYLDLKRMSGGEPLPVFAPVKVKFQEVVTA